MEECIFCKIVAGKVPSYKVFEDETSLAILDKYPSIRGQVVVIAKPHQLQGFAQMELKTATGLITVAKKLAGRIITGLKCQEVTFVIEGLDVAHAHAKIFPVYSREEYIKDIKQPGREAKNEELEVISQSIRKGE
jgi:histidine triad (HIT) family protein